MSIKHAGYTTANRPAGVDGLEVDPAGSHEGRLRGDPLHLSLDPVPLGFQHLRNASQAEAHGDYDLETLRY